MPMRSAEAKKAYMDEYRQTPTEKARRKAYMAAWYLRNRDRVLAQKIAYNHANAERIAVTQARYRARTKYGMTLEERNTMLAQGCRICSRPATAIDHDHDTGEVRGPLCDGCNRGLGMFEDNPALLERAIAYLERAF
jgi:hypothetical protein